MSTLLSRDPQALQLLMNEDLYSLINENAGEASNADAEIKPEPATAILKDDAPPYFDYLGENNKYTLVLVDAPSCDHISPKDLETLLNILKGKKQELKDVAILNTSKYPSLTFESLKDFFACNTMILFGINPSRLALEGVQSNQIISKDGTKILATYSFKEMMESIEKKRTFWEEMKKI